MLSNIGCLCRSTPHQCTTCIFRPLRAVRRIARQSQDVTCRFFQPSQFRHYGLIRNLPAKSHKAKDDSENVNSTFKTKRLSSQARTMASRIYFENTATSLAALGRAELVRRIRNFRGRFRLDFTDDYLNNLSIDRLRHILLAALINAK